MQAIRTIHYGWIIVLTGVGVLFSCLGLGRFALGMLLPSMGGSLGLSYSEMGLISTGNFIGYLVSVIVAGILSDRIGARLTIVFGLFLVGGSMVMMGFGHGFVDLLLLYSVTGFGSGLANVALMGMIGFWFCQHIRGRAAGFMITGNGLAIAFAGIYVPIVNHQLGAEGWRHAWGVMGVTALIIAVIAALLVRNHPSEKGLKPMGEGAPDALHCATADPDAASARSGFSLIAHLGGIYMLFGATYAVYATFIVTSLVNDRGYAEAVAGNFWSAVGLLSVFSGPLFGWASDRWGRKIGMIAVFTTFTLSYGMAATRLPESFLYVSIVLYGLSAWSVPTIMAATVGDYMGPARAAKAFGLITVFFSIGQIAGPATAGFLADAAGNFRIAFWMCALLTASAVGLAFLLKPSAR